MKRNYDPTFSVIIPTLWRPATLLELLQTLDSSNMVSEIIIIDNARHARPSLPNLRKIKLIDPGKNLYVNPSWNEGVKMAQQNLICICNDDVLFDFNLVANFLIQTNALKGIVGIHPSSFTKETWLSDEVQLQNSCHLAQMWGCIMFLKKRNYKPIPGSLRIWFGDNWLAYYCRPSKSIITKVITKHSESVADPVFQNVLGQDIDNWHNRTIPLGLQWRNLRKRVLSIITSKIKKIFSNLSSH